MTCSHFCSKVVGKTLDLLLLENIDEKTLSFFSPRIRPIQQHLLNVSEIIYKPDQ